VSSCVLILVQMCPHTTMCVLILLYVCPHATYVSSYYYTCVLMLYMCPHTTVCIHILLYMRPHTTVHVPCLPMPSRTVYVKASAGRHAIHKALYIACLPADAFTYRHRLAGADALYIACLPADAFENCVRAYNVGKVRRDLKERACSSAFCVSIGTCVLGKQVK
jgi:hypothetical protein